jgi:hypothetical protein
MKMKFAIRAVEEGAVISVSASERELTKEYPSMKAASIEAVELGIMLPSEKEIVDRSQLRSDYPQGFKGEAPDIDVAELVQRGFRILKNEQAHL